MGKGDHPQMMMDLLKEVRDDVKMLRDEVTILKTQRDFAKWVAGGVGGVVVFVAQHAVAFLKA
jgi:hypothetical protein